MSRIADVIHSRCPNGVPHYDLGDIVKLNFGTRITKRDDQGTLYPVYGGGGESFRTDHFNREDEYVVSRFAMSPQCVRRVTGKFWMLDSGFTFDPVGDAVDKHFVAHVLLSMQPEIYACSSQGAQKNLKTDEFRKFRIPVPPVDVQREIVRILDTYCEVEAELEAELLAELDARRIQGAHYRKAILEFGEDVTWLPLGRIAAYQNGKAHERLVSEDGDIPLVTARFISRNGDANRFVSQRDVQTSARTGDIALVLSDLPKGRALARTFFVDRDDSYAINQRVARIRVIDPALVDAKFLCQVLNRNPGLLAHDNGVDQTHLSKGQVVDLMIPVPAIDEQRRIAAILDRLNGLMTELAEALPDELQARCQQYEYYRTKLLAFEESIA